MFTVEEILKAVDGRVVAGERSLTVRKVCIDSRAVGRRDLFVAIRGERLDGHRFVRNAVAKGAAAVLVSRAVKVPASVTVIRVKDTTRALGLLARYHRKRFSLPVIAVTGSAGKTTTKEMIAAVLGSRLRVLKNSGSENNQIGVPLTLLKLRSAHEAAVLELGTNRPGDIRWLTFLAGPDIAVFTNIGASHLQRLKTPQRVFREKLWLAKGLPAGGTVVYNADDAFLRNIPEMAGRRHYVSYGVERPADWRARGIVLKGRRLEFSLNGRRFALAQPVGTNVSNALAAISCGRMFNISYNNIKKSISRNINTSGRQDIRRVAKVWLIDDSYNANPVSFLSAIHTLRDFPARGRRILVCADMLELGRQAVRWHAAAGRAAAGAHLDYVLTTGRLAGHISREAGAGGTVARHYAGRGGLHRALRKILKPGDVVLVKGSHAMRMDLTVSFIHRARVR